MSVLRRGREKMDQPRIHELEYIKDMIHNSTSMLMGNSPDPDLNKQAIIALRDALIRIVEMALRQEL